MAFALQATTYGLTGSFRGGGYPPPYSPQRSGPGFHYISSASLQAWWRMNEDVSASGDITDSSGNSRPASPGAPRPGYDTAVFPSNYVQTATTTFDGASTGTVSVGADSVWNPIIGAGVGSSRQMTFVVWAYRTSESDHDNILSFGSDVFISLQTDQTINFYARWTSLARWATAAAVIPLNTWTHIALVYDANSTANNPLIYINGASVTVSREVAPTGAYDDISGNCSINKSDFTGNLADIAIWNTILSAEDIKAIHGVAQTGAYRATRNYNIQGSNADPSFTGSVAPFIQGINVDSYDRFGAAIAPLLGRASPDTYFLSSSKGMSVLASSDRFFDDSFNYPAPIATSSGGTARITLGSDTKIICVPSYYREQRAFGYERNWDETRPFEEMDRWNAVLYLENSSSMQWPVVLDNPSAIDIFDFTGVIEPFTLRKRIAGTALFIGDHFDPDPHSVKGSVFSGERQTGFYRASFKSNNFYDINDSKMLPFEHLTDTTGLGELAPHVKPVSFVAQITSSTPPFVETTPIQEIFDLTTNPEVARFYSYNGNVYKDYNLLQQFGSAPKQDWPLSYKNPPSGSLMAWWRLNQDVSVSGDVADSSGNNRTGSFADKFNTIPDSYIRPAYSTTLYPSPFIQEASNGFPDDVAVGINVGTEEIWNSLIGAGGTSKMSFSFWIYMPTSIGSTVQNIFQFGSYETSAITSGGVALSFYNHGSATDYFRFHTRWNGTEIQWTSEDISYEILENVWHHVVVTYNGTLSTNNPIFYINGALKSTDAPATTPSAPWDGIERMCGCLGSGQGSYPFGGNLADFAVWDMELSIEQVKALYYAHAGVYDLSTNWLFTTGSTILGRPSATSRSVAVGFTYDNSEIGIDSIIFGGLLK
tara:strand:- start:466 stop:3099 length:2634 start_codon:yes stop_codon:yes gene_type:complete